MMSHTASTLRNDGRGHSGPYDSEKGAQVPHPFRDVCGKCGGRRVDLQLGLEATPAEYVAKLVAVFREVRRVLRKDGTAWVNLGDSYAGSWGAQGRDGEMAARSVTHARAIAAAPRKQRNTGSIPDGSGLKPKDLCGIPWRLAFALQDDGWWLRQDIIWSKPNPMPESVTDRCTKAHEYIFLLTKSDRYYYDADAIKEPAMYAADRNKRSVWTVSTQAFSGAQLLADYVGSDGRPYKVSADCPVHGLRREYGIPQTASRDARPDSCRNGNAGTSSRRGRELEDEFASTLFPDADQICPEEWPAPIAQSTTAHKTSGVDADSTQSPLDNEGTTESSAYSLGSSCLSRSGSATSHNIGTRKTARAPETSSPCIVSEENPSGKQRSEEVLGSVDSVERISGSSTSQGDLDDHPSAQTESSISGKVAQCNCTAISIDHFATFPEELIVPCILAGSPTGGTVLDPFSGSGTTGVVALRYHREYIGIELNPEYAAMSERRIIGDAPLFNLTSATPQLPKEQQ